VSAVQKWAAQCHGTDAGHVTQRRTVTGMALPGELAEQRRGVIPRRVRGMREPAGVRALNGSVGGASAGAMCPWEPSSEADLT
jgi:hypothetical protein